MFKAGMDQASKLHNSVVILSSGGVALAPSILFYSSHFGDLDKWAFGAGVFTLILVAGLLLYEFSLLIEAHLIDDHISKSTDLEEMFQNIKNDKFLHNWYRFLQEGKRDQESLHLVIDQLAFRLLFWLTLLQGTIIGISTFAFNQWNEYSNIIIWEIALFLLIAPFLIFRILQIGKYLYLLRELSLPENSNILMMKPENKMYPCCCCCENNLRNTSEEAEMTCNCCSCKMNQCKNIGQIRLCCKDFPKYGECIASRTIINKDNIFFLIGALIISVSLSALIFVILSFFKIELNDLRGLYGMVVIVILLTYPFKTNLFFTEDSLLIENEPIQFSERLFLKGNTIIYKNKKYTIAKRFSKHPEKLIEFLNAMQIEWGRPNRKTI
jgi:hypothetical protein